MHVHVTIPLRFSPKLSSYVNTAVVILCSIDTHIRMKILNTISFALICYVMNKFNCLALRLIFFRKKTSLIANIFHIDLH